MIRETVNNETGRWKRRNLVFLCVVALLAAACGSTSNAGKNHDPVITELIASMTSVSLSQQVTLDAIVSDQDGDSLTSRWEATAGRFLQNL